MSSKRLQQQAYDQGKNAALKLLHEDILSLQEVWSWCLDCNPWVDIYPNDVYGTQAQFIFGVRLIVNAGRTDVPFMWIVIGVS